MTTGRRGLRRVVRSTGASCTSTNGAVRSGSTLRGLEGGAGPPPGKLPEVGFGDEPGEADRCPRRDPTGSPDGEARPCAGQGGGAAGFSRMPVSMRKRVMSLRMENAALKAEMQELRDRVAALEAQNDELRSSRSAMSKSLFGRKSEKGSRLSSHRGQQPGAPGHGGDRRSRRRRNARRRTHASAPTAARPMSPTDRSQIIEIEVKAHTRMIVRPRRTCGCASSPCEVTAVPRLFPGTSFGTSVWAHVLHERYMSMRPACR